jgi:hypothetical protein
MYITINIHTRLVNQKIENLKQKITSYGKAMLFTTTDFLIVYSVGMRDLLVYRPMMNVPNVHKLDFCENFLKNKKGLVYVCVFVHLSLFE